VEGVSGAATGAAVGSATAAGAASTAGTASAASGATEISGADGVAGSLFERVISQVATGAPITTTAAAAI
jgi:hypothetical protein